LVLAGDGHGTALLNSVSASVRSVAVSVPGSGRPAIASYDRTGRLWRRTTGADAATVTVTVPPGGFAVVRR
jgi:hypothetical protein